MEPVTMTLGAGIFAIVSAIGTVATVYYKLKGSVASQIDNTITKEIKATESKMELRVQALEIELKHLSDTTVRTDELAGLRSDLKAVIQRIEDMIRRFEGLKRE